MVQVGLYVAALILTGIMTIAAFIRPRTKTLSTRIQLALLQTLVSEYSHLLLTFKFAVFYLVRNSPFWSSNTMQWLYWVDVWIMLTLWGLFLQSYFVKHPIYEATKFYRNQTSTEPPKILTVSFFFRFLNPLWHYRGVLVQDNICYATQEELDSEPSSKRFWKLDIYQHSSFPKQRPVVLYIHGGLWTSGDKSEAPPMIPYLALKQYVVVCINYRLAPEFKFTDQLVDVKRAIRWIRQNIHTFGGDPSYIAVCGSSSGGQLATMAAMTGNQAQYQPGFTDVETKVDACISINGIYDLTNFKNKFKYNFTAEYKKLCLDTNDSYLREISPFWILKDAQERKTLETASQQEKLGLTLPPFMIIQ